MLAKLTSKNQLTLPKAAVESVGAPEYFEVEVRDGQIVLSPVRIQRGDAVRGKLAALGLAEGDVADAVGWARAATPRAAVAADVAAPRYAAPTKRSAAAAPGPKKATGRRA